VKNNQQRAHDFYENVHLGLDKQSQVKPGKAATVQCLQKFKTFADESSRKHSKGCHLQICAIHRKTIFRKFCSIFPLPSLDAALGPTLNKRA
jgi:hypothetical protein